MMDSFHIGDRHILESSGSFYSTYDESKMEVVKAFNSELVSLYDIKPPISKAKMTAITKAAMKSVKFYKHVVHGVEKFILKCRPDYKIPGLYVIDSIVRQSRHQFGVEKDVFAPRFTKNLLQTFKNICLCPEEDKQKLVRVINLWQKHKVFPEELLQKFLIMVKASDEELPELYRDEIEKSTKKSPTTGKKKKKSPIKSGLESVTASVHNSYFTGSAGSARAGALNDNKNSVDPNLIQQLQTLTSLLQQSNVPASNSSPVTSGTTSHDQVKFDKKLLEFDYGEEEDDVAVHSNAVSANIQSAANESLNSILTNPEILRQLQSLQVQLSMAQAQAQHKQQEQAASILDQQRMFHFNQALMQQQYQQEENLMNSSLTSDQYNMSVNSDDDLDDKPEIVMEKHASEPLEVIDLDHIPSPPSDHSPRRSYSRSRSRSQSRSRSRRNRSRRSRSKSWNRNRSRDRDRNDGRRRKALPPIKRRHLAVCSTTLWVGHLSKLVQEQDLSDTFGQYGDIVSIDLIPPRGCAFLCMNRRQDADKALQRLKNTKLHGKPITIAWAPGKGMKGREWKDYWEVDYGVSYIPWSKLKKETDFDLLEDGGMMDQETMPDWLKAYLEDKRKISYSGGKGAKGVYTPSGTDMDESENEDDNPNTNMVIEPSNGVSDQIPLPDGPHPNVDMPPGLSIPLPPRGPPPPGLVNPFGLPPRLLAPLNFIPPLGVPPNVASLMMANRLPPPFPGPPGLPLLNPPGANNSLSQIPLPDSNTSSVSSTDFKPPPFPLLFPGNPNLNMDLPGNALIPPADGSQNDDTNCDKNPPFAPPFLNLAPPFKVNQHFVKDDVDYRVLGDISNSNEPNDSNNAENNSDVAGSVDARDKDERPISDSDRERYPTFLDRSRNFEDRDNRFFDRNHRFGDSRASFKEDLFENERRDGFGGRRSRFDRDFNRGEFMRGGRDFRGRGAPSRFRERDRFRDNRRDFDNRRTFDKRERSPEKSEDTRNNGKRSRWSDANAPPAEKTSIEAEKSAGEKQWYEKMADQAWNNTDNVPDAQAESKTDNVSWYEKLCGSACNTDAKEEKNKTENVIHEEKKVERRQTNDVNKTQSGDGRNETTAKESSAQQHLWTENKINSLADEIANAAATDSTERETGNNWYAPSAEEHSANQSKMSNAEEATNLNENNETQGNVRPEPAIVENMDAENTAESRIEYENTRTEVTPVESLMSNMASITATVPSLMDVPIPESISSDPNKFDMFADDAESHGELAEPNDQDADSDLRLWNGPNLFQNRIPLMDRSALPLMQSFGPNSPTAPFHQRSRYPPPIRQYPPFFQHMPRMFSPFNESRQTRPFMPSRSNNF